MQVTKTRVHKNGDPSVLTQEKITFKPNQKNGLLVEIWVMGVGFADIMAQRGGYPLAPKKPFTPGYDFVGRIKEAYHSTQFKKGDMVAALLPVMGAYTDIIEVPEKYLVKLPAKLSIDKAAASILNYITAYSILEEKAKVKSGDVVFIQGASGGVGMALSQIGKLMGLKMYGTSSVKKHFLLKENGVIPIDYAEKDFIQLIKEDYPDGISAAFDARGGDSLKKCLQLIKPGRVVVTYGFSGDGFGGYGEMIRGILQVLKVKLSPNRKRIEPCGAPGEVKNNPGWYRETLKKVFAHIERGDYSPLIDSTYPLEEVQKAHERFEGANLKGKILLTTSYYQG